MSPDDISRYFSTWKTEIKTAAHLSEPLRKERSVNKIVYSEMKWSRHNMKALADVVIQCASDGVYLPMNGSDRFAQLASMFCKAFLRRFSDQSFSECFKEALDESFLFFWGTQSNSSNAAGPIEPNSSVASVNQALLLCELVGSLCPKKIISREDIKQYILTIWSNATTTEHLLGIHLILNRVGSFLWQSSTSPASRVTQFLEESSFSSDEAVKRCTACIFGFIPHGFRTVAEYSSFIVSVAKCYADWAEYLGAPRETRRAPLYQSKSSAA